MTEKTAALRAEFVRAHTSMSRAPLCPEISIRLAHEDTELWRATESWLGAREVPPPFWAFAWPGGQALARFLLDHADVVRGFRAVDFGCGSGIVAIAAALSSARDVRACDTDLFAHAATMINAEDNAVVIETMEDVRDVSFDRETVLLAADIFYDRKTAADAMAILSRARESGAAVILADPRRPYFSSDSFDHLATFDVPVLHGLESKDVMPTDIFRMR